VHLLRLRVRARPQPAGSSGDLQRLHSNPWTCAYSSVRGRTRGCRPAGVLCGTAHGAPTTLRPPAPGAHRRGTVLAAASAGPPCVSRARPERASPWIFFCPSDGRLASTAMSIETKRMVGWCIGVAVRAAGRRGASLVVVGSIAAPTDRASDRVCGRRIRGRMGAGVEMLNWGRAARQIGREPWVYGAHGAASVRRSVLGLKGEFT
jgi:hypothetical protein